MTEVASFRGLRVVVDANGHAVLRAPGGGRYPIVEVRQHPRLARALLAQLGRWLRAAAGRWPDTNVIVRAVRWAVELLSDAVAWTLAVG